MIVLVHCAYSNSADVIQNFSVVICENKTNYRGSSVNITQGAPNWGRIVFKVTSIYRDFLGQLAWFSLIALPFVMMWITHADIVPAAIAWMFFGLYVLACLGSQCSYVVIVFIAVKVASVISLMWLKRGG